jgi:hypothetical protein
MEKMRWSSLIRISLKVVIFFVVLNLLFSIVHVEAWIGNLSGYNYIFPGRTRFPFGENPGQAYNLTMNNINAMFASHEVSKKADETEYRVFLIGDSSQWGTLLRPEETLSAQLNQLNLQTCDGRTMHFYNLGYPTLSWMKDLMMMDKAKEYQPDMIIWMVTLESAVAKDQLQNPLLEGNQDIVQTLIEKYGLSQYAVSTGDENILTRNIFTERRNLADLFRLQAYGVLWAATGIDQYYPERYDLAKRDFDAGDDNFHELKSPLKESDLSFDIIAAGRKVFSNVPFLIINEPIMISSGENSDIRYDYYYPRWAYDDYRELMEVQANENDWNYLDIWNLVNEYEFTNTAIHLTPDATTMVAEKIAPIIQKLAFEKMNCTGNQSGITYSLPEVTKEPVSTPTEESVVTQTIAPTLQVSTVQPLCDAEKWQEMPVIPAYLSPEIKKIYKDGLVRGNNEHAFSVIGDCQNVPSVFLGSFDDPNSYDLGEYGYLQDVIEFYKGSFSRRGAAVSGGFNVARVLSPLAADPAVCNKNETPLECELRIQKPSVVFISMETWWSKRPAETYEQYMRQIIEIVLKNGAVPILATKADNLEGDNGINYTITKLACEYDIPLWNFYAAVQPLPGHGVWSDGFHLTVGLNYFNNPENMKTGRSVRNLTALQSLYSIWTSLQQ